MKKLMSISVILLIALLSSLSAQQVLSSAGAQAVGNNVQLSWTIGETVIETYTGTSVILTQGFHQSRLIVTNINPVESGKFSLMVYPNPVQWDLKLELKGNIFSNFNYSLYDISGKLLQMKRMDTNPENITMKNYPSGEFFLRISEKENEFIQTFKIIKK